MDLCLFLTAEFHGIWESLVYEGEVKTQVKIKWNAVKKWLCQSVILLISIVLIFLQLLDYVTTTIYFSDKNVDCNLISWNRVVLLHGKKTNRKLQ